MNFLFDLINRSNKYNINFADNNHYNHCRCDYDNCKRGPPQEGESCR